ncbi:MAG: hypothetical protein ACQCN3_02375 [Candidatus Bathyarchaeia archaeon]|jgi:hypothetical protein
MKATLDAFYKIGKTVTKDIILYEDPKDKITLYRVASRRRNSRTEDYTYTFEPLDPRTEQQHIIENYIVSYIPGATIIIFYYKEVAPDKIADTYSLDSAEEVAAVFEQLKAYVPTPIPEDCKTICDLTKKPCDPESWLCHRQFAALRFLKNHPGNRSKNASCSYLKTKESEGSKTQ